MIRAARLADAGEIARVHVTSWQRIYRGLFPDAYLDALSVDGRRALWEEVLGDGVGVVGVAEREGGIVGFVSVAESRDSDAPAGTGELTAIYLDPVCWRGGLGRELMAWAVEKALERDWRRLTLWVLRDNEQARAFYHATGWRPEGAAQIEVIGGVETHELRYVLNVKR